MLRLSLLSPLFFLPLINASLTFVPHVSPIRHNFFKRSLHQPEEIGRPVLTRRATPALPPGWSTTSQCVTDAPSSRLLTVHLFDSDNLTIDSCTSQANSLGYTYAGVQYSKECWAGNSLNTAGGAGATSTGCTMACTGDSTMTCGGSYALNLYTKTTTGTSDWGSPICMKDDSTRALSNRIDTGNQFNSMTWETCQALCDAAGYTYCATQYGGECWGSNTLTTNTGTGLGLAADPSNCNMNCNGNPNQKCGGSYYGNLFTKGSGGGTGPPGWPTGWATTSTACITDYVQTRRALEYSVGTSGALTNLQCVQTCNNLGYEYAGTENGNECYCGHYVNRLNGGQVVATANCNSPCTGNASEKCGGFSLITLWQKTSTQGPQPWVSRLPPNWTNSSSCVVDSSNPRALDGSNLVSESLDLESCVAYCEIMGYSMAGAEYGHECWCGDSINSGNNNGATTTGCDSSCPGNSAQKCGAGYKMTLFTKTVYPLNLPSGWSQKFCSYDSSSTSSSNILQTKVTVSGGMTPAKCVNACPSGSTWAGVKNGNECYCGTYTGYTQPSIPADCSTTCPGDSHLTCGGSSRTMLFNKAPGSVPTNQQYALSEVGNSGVVMTGIAVMNAETVVVFDRKENNPLTNSQGKPAWAAVWNIDAHNARGLDLLTHSFCSAGAWLSNGTFVNFGGQGFEDRNGQTVAPGFQGIRLFNPCPAAGNCQIYENPSRIRLGDLRWYPTTARLHDGSVFILGGSKYPIGWTNSNNAASNNYEFYPSKNINNGMPIASQFLADSMPHNTYPIVFHLPNHDLFVAANNLAMTLNWQTGAETRLPNLPNGQRVTYPYSGGAVMLPLTPENNYTPEIMICGGSHNANEITEHQLSAQTSPTSTQCSRLVLSSAGIAAGWKTEWMPDQRIMSDLVLLPNGKVVIVNGAKTGTASYGNLQFGNGPSNADHPTFTPLLYDPAGTANFRFSYAGMPTSDIPRLYHSAATLLPSGAILIGGSNPNDDFATAKYPSELRVEYLYPSYFSATRPTFSGLPAQIGYGGTFTLTCTFPSGTTNVAVVLMDLGWSTHNVHMDQRYVKLVSSKSGNSVTVTAPPNAGVYSPGPGFIWVVADDVPSTAQKILIGDGSDPPFSQTANEYMLSHT